MAAPIKLSGIKKLTQAIQKANKFFLAQTQRQVNTSLTLRNWLVGYYIVEYEQNGKDRAEYGGELLQKLAIRLKTLEIKGLSYSILNVCRQFYQTYPQIILTLSQEFQLNENQSNRNLQTLSKKFPRIPPTLPNILLNKFSFSHFAELLKADSYLKRTFYETQALTNNWSVRELRRAMDSMLFERTGLSKDKAAVLEKQRKGSAMHPADLFRDPYLNEAAEGDNPPIGIILCTDKNETLVKYTTSDMKQKIFVSKYMTKLPSEKDLQKIISTERDKIKSNTSP
jgi:hypothetical protein